MTDRQWLPTDQWFASLPTVYVAASGLITDERGRVLLVEPNYRPHWTFPGGIVEADEAPHHGCKREVQEELGLDLEVGRLLVVDWAPPIGERPRPIVHMMFDCGTLGGNPVIQLQYEELDSYAFVSVSEGMDLLDPAFAARLPAAVRARSEDETVYLPARTGR